MSDDKKSAFGEKTVVHSSRPTAGDSHADDTPKVPPGADKTVVFAQSNLKETFDARTVVRPSKSVAAESPRLPEDAPGKVLAAEPFGASSGEAVEKPKMSKTERRAARAALDRKTRTLIAAFATLCALVVVCLFFAFDGAKSVEKTALAPETKAEPSRATTLASEAEPPPAAKVLPSLGGYKSTTDVLGDFDRAAKKAQEHAFEYSK